MDEGNIRTLWVQSGPRLCGLMIRLKDYLYAMYGVTSEALGLPSYVLAMPNTAYEKKKHRVFGKARPCYRPSRSTSQLTRRSSRP